MVSEFKELEQKKVSHVGFLFALKKKLTLGYLVTYYMDKIP